MFIYRGKLAKSLFSHAEALHKQTHLFTVFTYFFSELIF